MQAPKVIPAHSHCHHHLTQVGNKGSIDFPRMDDLGLEYSVFYVARMTGGRKGRVIDGGGDVDW